MLKIEDVKVGDELVCIDRDGFCEYLPENTEILDFPNLVVRKNTGTMVFLEGTRPSGAQNFISAREVRFFKKKEQSQKYTFDDLVDVAVQAWKDDVTKSITLVDGVLCVSEDRLSDAIVAVGDKASSQFYSDAIHAIQSLYKETFVIEVQEDIERLKHGAKVTLKNGEAIYFSNIDDGDYWFDFDHVDCQKFPYLALKGATVEQERGRDD